MGGKICSKQLTPEVVKQMVVYFDYLALRWEDEHKYENVRDYVAAFEKKFKVKVLKFQTFPLSFAFRVGDQLCALVAAAREIKFKTIEAPQQASKPPRRRQKVKTS